MMFCIPLTLLLSLFLLSRRISAQDFLSPLVEPSVVNSPAYMTNSQFFSAVNASLPYLNNPLTNRSIMNLAVETQYAHPDFINYAVNIGNITSKDEMAMYLAHVLYHSNGLQQKIDPMCEQPNGAGCMSLNLNATVYGTSVNYFGRGYLWLQGQSAYQDCTKDLFGEDATLLTYPDAINHSDPLNWAVSAWTWKTFVQPYMTTFGSTIKLLRPTQCTGSSVTPAPEALAAWNIYAAILKIVSPTSGPSASFC